MDPGHVSVGVVAEALLADVVDGFAVDADGALVVLATAVVEVEMLVAFPVDVADTILDVVPTSLAPQTPLLTGAPREDF